MLDWSSEDKQHLSEELSDVLLYLIRLADKCNVDLPKAAVAKMEHNRKKYPVDKFYGSSRKYNELKDEAEVKSGDDTQK